MITNSNETKTVTSGEYLDIKKYIGVGTVKVVAVNPKNADLRKYGWPVEEDAPEPSYVYEREAQDGSKEKYAKVRFLLQIVDLPEKPVVAYDIWVRPEYIIGSESGKVRIIDAFGRTAWATKDDVKEKRIPEYANGPAKIDKDYKGCHPGQEKLVAFLFRLLNVTPLRIYSKAAAAYVDTKDPGKVTIDKWPALCLGDASEIKGYCDQYPDNVMKVIFGVKTTDDNKIYQTVLDFCEDVQAKNPFIANNNMPDRQTGDYTVAVKRIEAFKTQYPNSTENYSAKPVSEYSIQPTDVTENSENKTFPEDNNFFGNNNDDLPFA